MSQDRSRFPASFSDSDEEDESASFFDSEEEDESASYSDSATTVININVCGSCPCCRKSEEIAKLKQKLSFCESNQRQTNDNLHHQLGMIGSIVEIINRNDEMFKRYDEQNHKLFKQTLKIQKWMTKMIQETRQLVMTGLLPPEQQPMQQQQPLLPAAAAAATLQPQPMQQQQPLLPAAAAVATLQPQLGRTGEDEGEKNASEDLM